MILINRSGKIVAALAVAGLTLLIFQHLTWIQGQVTEYTGQLPDSIKQHLPQSGAEQTPETIETNVELIPEPTAPDNANTSENDEAHTELDTENTPDTVEAHAELPSGPSSISEDAHRLQAEEFLPHIKAITESNGMTMAEAKAGCTWAESDAPNFQYNGETEWVKNERNDSEIEFRRQEIYEFLRNGLLPYESYKNRFEGRGIVMVAGQQSLDLIKVNLRVLKRLGSKLPVELCFFDHEMDEKSKKELLEITPDLYFCDLSNPDSILKTHYNVFGNNYHLKTAGIMNSRFAEALLLDSDNVPVLDPELLFETETYKEYGTIFWPDIARTRPSNPMWAITNTACRMNEYEQESGQMLVDKRRFFYHLQLSYWLGNTKTEYYNYFLLGDKDLFRFVWHGLKTKYGAPKKLVTSVGTLTPVKTDEGKEENFYCGHSFAQHHPNGSVAFIHGGTLKTWSTPVLRYQKENRGGIFQTYKRSQWDEQHEKLGHAMLKWDGASWLPNRPADLQPAWCSDFPDSEAKPLDEIIPGGFEHIFDECGGYWMLTNDRGY